MRKITGSVAILGIALLAATTISATARGYLSEGHARLKAANILKGDPYGQTTEIAASRIKKAQLLLAGTTDCGSIVRKPVWQFYIQVPKGAVSYGNDPIDGYLVIDAISGKLDCAGLPFLD